MNETVQTVQQVTSVMDEIINKCRGPSKGEFVTLDQCVYQLTNTIDAQDKKIKEQAKEIEALKHADADDADDAAADADAADADDADDADDAAADADAADADDAAADATA